MNILLILLGCNIGSILMNRFEASFRFIENDLHSTNELCIVSNPLLDLFEPHNTPTTQITWFLSGGIKNNFKGAKTEASILKSQIDNNISLKSTNDNDTSIQTQFESIKWNFVLDEKSTNTAENFIWASQFLNTTTQVFDDIYVVTSDFHFQRASRMLKLIDPSRNFKWILGDLEEKDSRYWETIHIQNVESDVAKARVKLQALL
jgi:hypothetical protein